MTKLTNSNNTTIEIVDSERALLLIGLEDAIDIYKDIELLF